MRPSRSGLPSKALLVLADHLERLPVDAMEEEKRHFWKKEVAAVHEAWQRELQVRIARAGGSWCSVAGGVG